MFSPVCAVCLSVSKITQKRVHNNNNNKNECHSNIIVDKLQGCIDLDECCVSTDVGIWTN